jgi:hypothetical protein
MPRTYFEDKGEDMAKKNSVMRDQCNVSTMYTTRSIESTGAPREGRSGGREDCGVV